METLDGLDEGPDGFLDTAAVMANLDLVITSDTSIAHLAGALGRPVWVALRLVPDWRWMLDRADSPWYPTMRLFRQSHRRRLGAGVRGDGRGAAAMSSPLIPVSWGELLDKIAILEIKVYRLRAPEGQSQCRRMNWRCCGKRRPVRRGFRN